MAVNQLNYEQFQTEAKAIDGCIQNIETELSNANKSLNDAVADGSGRWAATDAEEWNAIYADINKKFSRMQELMKAAGYSANETASTEAAYSGFNAS